MSLHAMRPEEEDKDLADIYKDLYYRHVTLQATLMPSFASTATPRR